MARHRPASPFLMLLLGGGATALTAEWLRFQADWTLATAPAALGAAATLTAVARAYRARRRWRRSQETALRGEAPLPQADASSPIRVEARAPEGERRPTVLRDDPPAPLAGAETPDTDRLGVRPDAGARDDARDDTRGDAAQPPGARRGARVRDAIETD